MQNNLHLDSLLTILFNSCLQLFRIDANEVERVPTIPNNGFSKCIKNQQMSDTTNNKQPAIFTFVASGDSISNIPVNVIFSTISSTIGFIRFVLNPIVNDKLPRLHPLSCPV